MRTTLSLFLFFAVHQAQAQGTLVQDSARLAWVVGKVLRSKPKPLIPPEEIHVLCTCGRGTRLWVEDANGRVIADQIYVDRDLRFIVPRGSYVIRAEDSLSKQSFVKAGVRGGESVRLGNPIAI